MWKLKEISASNFMSFNQMSFEFSDKCYIVKANNLDNEGQQSNGGGKTSFVDVICVLLLGYSLTGRNVKDCINWHSELSSLKISGTLVNNTHNLKCFIERTIYNNSRSQELVILVNDQVPSIPTKKGVENGVDIKAGNAYILNDILDITADDLLNYYLISKQHYKPFLNISTDNKIEVIARFSNADVVDKVINKLDKELDDLDNRYIKYVGELSSIQGYIEGLQSSLDNTDRLKVFESNKKLQLVQLNNNKQQVEKKLLELEQNSIDLQQQIVAIKYEDFNYEWVEENYPILHRLKQDLADVQLSKQEFVQQKILVENHLAGLITCPKCEHQFLLQGEQCYTQEDSIAIDNAIVETDGAIELLVQQVNDLQRQISEATEIQERNVQKDKQKQSLQQQIDSIVNHQTQLLQQYDQIEKSTIVLQQQQFIDSSADIKRRIAEKIKEKQLLESKIESTNRDLGNKKQWIDHFNDFKFYLGNQPIETICSLVNQYLKLNGSDLNLHIEGFKQLRSGEIRQALTPIIYRNWTNPQSVAQFSEGERVRLNLSVDLAFQQLINNNSKYGGLNLYINDELISGLDSLGVQNAAKAFNQLNKTIMLVTHSGADLVYENTINIEKKNNISKVI